MTAIVDIGKSILGIETSGEKAAKRAAGVQVEASEAGIAEQRRQFDITTGQLTEAQRLNRQQIELGRRRATFELKGGRNLQRQQLEPFAQAGVGALEQQQALLGLGTPEQQQEAFASFRDSPGQRFIRERAQRSLLRNQSAIGGIGGGNVRSALVQQGAGFAAQDFGNQFTRLGQLRTSGQQAAGDIGQGALGTSANLANVQFQAGQAIGAGAIGTAARQGQFGQQAVSNITELQQVGGQARASGILGAQQARKEGQEQVIELAAAAFSDKRLKRNIKKVGEFNGFNWYTWTWNNLAHSLGLFGDDNGVIADEVQKIKPDIVKEKNGFLTVNYAGLS